MSIFNKKEIEEKDSIIKLKDEEIKDLKQVNLLLSEEVKEKDNLIEKIKLAVEDLFIKSTVNTAVEDDTAKIQDNIEMMNMALDVSSSSLSGFARSIEKIATGTQETAASVNEITTTTQSAAKLAEELVKIAREGTVSSNKTIQSSKDILTTYTLMDNVVKLIIDISDRIKNLSINIKIEAARVGQNGRGFSVIADEVTNLSEEAANQVKGIYNIIFSMKELVIDGVARAEQTEKAFKQVEQIAEQNNSNAIETMSAMQQINVATNETSNVINDISRNIYDLEKPIEELKDRKPEVDALTKELTKLMGDEKEFLDAFNVDLNKIAV